MKKLVVLFLIIVIFLESSLRSTIILSLSEVWFLIFIYHFISVLKYKDKKVNTKEILEYTPNNNYSPYITYLITGSVNTRVFVSVILELILKGSISIRRYDKNQYYLIDEKSDIELTKSENYIKRLLFFDISHDEKVSINSIVKFFNKKSGYAYHAYKEWQNIFYCEAANNKYFKGSKDLVDGMLFFFAISFVLAFYNIVLVGNVYLALIIFILTSILTIIANNVHNREEEAIKEYVDWMKFKNYLNLPNNNISSLDNISLENYCCYAYSLDCMPIFEHILSNKDNDEISDSILLSLVNTGIFSNIEKLLIKSIKKAQFKSIVLCKKNKGSV